MSVAAGRDLPQETTPSGVVDKIAGHQWYALAVLTLLTTSLIGTMAGINGLVEPIRREFALGDTEMGLVVSVAFAVGNCLMVLPAGWLSDRVNRRNLLAASMVLGGCLSAAIGLMTGYEGMLLARFGVGLALAAVGPAASSLISDLFPPNRRSTAFGIYLMGTPVGLLVMFPLATILAQTYDWRWAMVGTALPSILVAILLTLTVREPVRGATETTTRPKPGHGGSEAAPSLLSALRYIASQRSALCLLSGVAGSDLIRAAGVAWLGSLLIRSHGMSQASMGTVMALGFGVGGIGNFLGGFIAERLGRRDTRWQIGVAIAATAGALASGIGMVLADNLAVAIILIGVWSACANAPLGPIFGLTQTLVPPTMRGTMGAVISILLMLVFGVGGGLGGFLSQALQPSLGLESLRWSLALMMLIYLPVMALYAVGMTRLKADLARA